MKKVVILLVVCDLAFVWPVPTGSEIVWLKDVTQRFQTYKRKVGDGDFPDDLTFYLSRGPHVLNLNLKRNQGINPNADVYFVRKVQDGGMNLEKTQNSENEDVAYYQDRENGAFMTVRCVKRSTGQCDRVIYGNIRIGDIHYNLRPAETYVTSKHVLDVPYTFGTRYVLQDQGKIEREISIENKDAEYVNEENLQKGFMDLIQRFPHGQDNKSYFGLRDFTASSRNIVGLPNREAKDKRNKQVYHVEITVLTDSTIWDLHSSLVHMADSSRKLFQVKRKIKQAFSHFINGAHLLYQGITDQNIDIKLTLRDFYIFQTVSDFRHRSSTIKTCNGKTCIDATAFLKDVAKWDEDFGSRSELEYDHVMLFTRHDLYDVHPANNYVKGISYPRGVCDKGRRVSVVEAFGIFSTVSTAAHELGHNLGADHDGEDDAKACDPNDLFIMSPNETVFARGKPYSRNPWMFSDCSVEAFKKTLKNKTCLSNEGLFFNIDEWNCFVTKSPGEDYSADKQCEIIYGPNYSHCGPVSADICLYMQCKDPKTKSCLPKHHIAARGTKCGPNMWCKEGICVPKLINRTKEKYSLTFC